MGVLRVHPVRPATFTPRSVGSALGGFDVQLAVYALALTVIGLLMAFANSEGTPLEPASLFARGLMWLALAVLVFVVTAAIDYRWIRTFAWPLYFVNIGLLLLTLVVGSGTGEVSRWVSIFGIQFQFSELAKIFMAVVIAHWIANRGSRVGSLWTIVGAAVIAGPPLLLVLIQPDLGTSLVFGAIVFGALFVSGASLRWLALCIAGGLAAFPLIWANVLKDYQKQRLISFLDPSSDPLGSGFQLLQSQIAVSAGGVFGRGLTNGSAGEFLPVQATDFVLSRVGEELGLMGGVVALVLFALLLWRVLHIGWRSNDLFGLAVAGGIAGMLLFQLLVNVGMVLGMVPITGIPLPFITHGGASLISIALGLGILESVATHRGRAST
jgi:rod shape determining protein RodA